MGYLKVNLKLRLFLFLIGAATLLYGVFDIQTGEAGRKGINSTKEEQPVSYYMTVGKKVLIGGGLALIALTPLLGSTANNRKEESENDER